MIDSAVKSDSSQENLNNKSITFPLRLIKNKKELLEMCTFKKSKSRLDLNN